MVDLTDNCLKITLLPTPPYLGVMRNDEDYYLDKCIENHPQCIKFVESWTNGVDFGSLFECEFDHAWEIILKHNGGTKWR